MVFPSLVVGVPGQDPTLADVMYGPVYRRRFEQSKCLSMGKLDRQGDFRDRQDRRVSSRASFLTMCQHAHDQDGGDSVASSVSTS